MAVSHSLSFKPIYYYTISIPVANDCPGMTDYTQDLHSQLDFDKLSTQMKDTGWWLYTCRPPEGAMSHIMNVGCSLFCTNTQEKKKTNTHTHAHTHAPAHAPAPVFCDLKGKGGW